ncbi:unnamed protein product [Hermetia illucens]|uniref:Uncharacterized protein n=1 Tax=Hermetia illucens TaxID=343691 RepID=A0A7R8YRJ2_HERIL|nr:unnamed protein product [Hermetia illucens]
MFLRDKLKRRKLNPKAEKFSTPSMLKEPSTSENYYNELAEQDENMDEGEQSATSEAPNPANSTKQILKKINKRSSTIKSKKSSTPSSTQLTSIKGVLLLHFDEPESESRLMQKILAAQFTTLAELYEYVTEQAANEIKLRREMVKYCYIDKCPEPVRGVLCAHKPYTLEAAYAVLVNAGYLRFSVNQNRNSSQYNNYNNTFRNHVSNRNNAPNQFNRNRNFSQYDNTFRNQVNHNLNHNYPPTQFNTSRNSSQNNYSNNNFRNQVYEPNNNQTQFNHRQNSGNYNQRPHSRNFRRNDLSMSQ